MYLFILAGLCFLVFLAKLRSRLLAAEGGTGELTSLVVAGGAVFVAILFVAAAARGGIGFAIKSPGAGELVPGADTVRYFPTIGYAALGAGGLLAAAIAMATMSWLIVRTAVFGRWLAWVGAVAALLVVVANVAPRGSACDSRDAHLGARHKRRDVARSAIDATHSRSQSQPRAATGHRSLLFRITGRSAASTT